MLFIVTGFGVDYSVGVGVKLSGNIIELPYQARMMDVQDVSVNSVMCVCNVFWLTLGCRKMFFEK